MGFAGKSFQSSFLAQNGDFKRCEGSERGDKSLEYFFYGFRKLRLVCGKNNIGGFPKEREF